MKRRLVFLVLVALSIGCDRRPQLRSAKGLSTEPATWHGGAWDGKSGTAVTIQFKDGTEQFWGAEDVRFEFDHSISCHEIGVGDPCGQLKNGVFWQVADFTVPVMKREPHALTLFFLNDANEGDERYQTNLRVLEQLPDQIEAGTLAVIPCIPDRIC